MQYFPINENVIASAVIYFSNPSVFEIDKGQNLEPAVNFFHRQDLQFNALQSSYNTTK